MRRTQIQSAGRPAGTVLVFAAMAVLLFCVALAAAQEEGFSLSARLSEERVHLGSHVDLTLEFDLPKGYGLLGFEKTDDAGTSYSLGLSKNLFRRAEEKGWFETAMGTGDRAADYIFDQEYRLAEPRGGQFVLHFRLVPWKLGTLQVDLPPAILRMPSAAIETVSLADRIQPLTLEVTPLLKMGQGETGPKERPLKGAADLPYTMVERIQQSAPQVAGVGIAGLLLLALIWWLVRPKPERVVPADEWARSELEHLLRRVPEAQPEIESWHFALGAALRGYVARRWPIHAEEMTSSEVLSALSTHAPDLSSARRKDFGRLLEEIDGVKFARQPATRAICFDRLDQSFKFVESTRPMDASPERSETAAIQRKAA